MLSWFRKKSELELLQEQYQKLLQESFALSTVDRKRSDLKRAEAEELGVRIEQLRTGQS